MNTEITYIQFKKKVKTLSVRIIKMLEQIDKNDTLAIIGSEIIKSATLAGVHYSAACIATTKKEFQTKMQETVSQTDATIFWLSILNESGLIAQDIVEPLLFEAEEILEVSNNIEKKASPMLALLHTNIFSKN